MPPIAAISFDADDTLWDFDSSLRAALDFTVRAFADAGLTRPQGPVTAAGLTVLREQAAVERPDATMDELRRSSLARAVEACGAPAQPLADQLYDAFTRERHARMQLFPEVREVLARLGAHFPLAVTTNGNGDPALAGLPGVFACVTNPRESGLRKPDPRIFRLTAERLGVRPGALLHVGDHPDEDARAALAAGLQARWLNRDGRPAEAGITGIPTLAALLDLCGVR